jgi:NNP family nitrate/nitrite transporter-like MFS transporter
MAEREKKRQKLKILVFLAFTAAFAIPNYSQYQLSPLAARLIEQYSLTNGQFTSLFSAPMIPAVFLCFISGVLVDKYGFKIIVGISVAITAAGCILRVFAVDYVTLYISMVLIGVSCGIVTGNAAKIIGCVFEPERVGVAVSMGVTISTAAMMAAMSTTALLPTTKSAFIFASCLGIADVVIWHTAIPKRRKRNAEELAELPSISKCLKTVLTNKYVWLAGIGNFCVCGAMVAVSSLISAALVTRGMDEASAGLVSSINLFGNLAGSLFVPLVAHKTGRLRLILVVCSIITAVGTAFSWRMPFGLLLYVSLFLTGVGVGSVLPQLIAICIKLPVSDPHTPVRPGFYDNASAPGRRRYAGAYSGRDCGRQLSFVFYYCRSVYDRLCGGDGSSAEGSRWLRLARKTPDESLILPKKPRERLFWRSEALSGPLFHVSFIVRLSLVPADVPGNRIGRRVCSVYAFGFLTVAGLVK